MESSFTTLMHKVSFQDNNYMPSVGLNLNISSLHTCIENGTRRQNFTDD